MEEYELPSRTVSENSIYSLSYYYDDYRALNSSIHDETDYFQYTRVELNVGPLSQTTQSNYAGADDKFGLFRATGPRHQSPSWSSVTDIVYPGVEGTVVFEPEGVNISSDYYNLSYSKVIPDNRLKPFGPHETEIVITDPSEVTEPRSYSIVYFIEVLTIAACRRLGAPCADGGLTSTEAVSLAHQVKNLVNNSKDLLWTSLFGGTYYQQLTRGHMILLDQSSIDIEGWIHVKAVIIKPL